MAGYLLRKGFWCFCSAFLDFVLRVILETCLGVTLHLCATIGQNVLTPHTLTGPHPATNNQQLCVSCPFLQALVLKCSMEAINLICLKMLFTYKNQDRIIISRGKEVRDDGMTDPPQPPNNNAFKKTFQRVQKLSPQIASTLITTREMSKNNFLHFAHI